MDAQTERDTRTETLVAFFKGLADANRLEIVGVLAQAPCSVEHLSAVLGIGSPTVSHHLKKLARVGLVEARSEGHYSVYSLRPEVLHDQAKALLGSASIRHFAHDVDLSAYDRKVLSTFTDSSGAITTFATQQKKVWVLLRHVLSAFETGVRYPGLTNAWRALAPIRRGCAAAWSNTV